MDGTPAPATLRVTTCDTDEALAGAAEVFDHYRQHYGEHADGRTLGWLTDMVGSGLLTVHTVAEATPGAPVVGIATGHPVPASLALGLSWQLRDLYVLPGARRRGAAAALVGAVAAAARTAGASRLTLVTEPDNAAALALYRRLGFAPLEGLTHLGLELPPHRPGAAGS